MTGVDEAAQAVGLLVADSVRGVPPVMIGSIHQIVTGQTGTRSGRAVWVTGLTMEQSAVVQARVWTQAFDERITAGTVTRGTPVVVAVTTTQPVQFVILDVAVTTPLLPALGVPTPL